MPISRTEVARETARRMRRLGLQNGEDIRRLRTEAGLSLAQVAVVVGVHKSHLARIERHEVQASLEALTAIGVALGADLGFRFFPGAGPRLHDRFQAQMIEAVLRALDPRWSIAPEVPVTQPSRGVIEEGLFARRAWFVDWLSTKCSLQGRCVLSTIPRRLRDDVGAYGSRRQLSRPDPAD